MEQHEARTHCEDAEFRVIGKSEAVVGEEHQQRKVTNFWSSTKEGTRCEGAELGVIGKPEAVVGEEHQQREETNLGAARNSALIVGTLSSALLESPELLLVKEHQQRKVTNFWSSTKERTHCEGAERGVTGKPEAVVGERTPTTKGVCLRNP